MSQLLDRLVADVAPIRDVDIEAAELDASVDALIAEVLGSSDPAATRPVAVPSRRRPWRLRLAISAAVVAVAAGLLILLGVGSNGSPSQPAFAAAAVRVAEANPRLLVTAPGWSVVRADEFQIDSGDVAFSDGTHTLDVTWYPAKYYDLYYSDRDEVDSDPEFFDLLGQKTRTVAYSDRDFATMLPPQGHVFLEIRSGIEGGGMTFEQYRALIDSLEPVDVETWLAAMPPNVVKPTDRAAVVDEMLADVPLPPDFDATTLRTDDGVVDRYQLAARSLSAVTCAWVDEWVAATRAGDAASAQAAVDALEVAAGAAILEEMSKEGAYPQVFQGFVRQFARGQVPGRAARSAAEHIDELQSWVRSGFSCA